jgi:hypothetical protein
VTVKLYSSSSIFRLLSTFQPRRDSVSIYSTIVSTQKIVAYQVNDGSACIGWSSQSNRLSSIHLPPFFISHCVLPPICSSSSTNVSAVQHCMPNSRGICTSTVFVDIIHDAIHCKVCTEAPIF